MRDDGDVELPAELREFLDGRDLERKDTDALGLITVDDTGWPHLALVSVGEVLAVSPSRVRIALWQDTTTTANLRRDGRAVLVHVAGGGATYVRLAAEPADGIQVQGERLAVFQLAAVDVIVDEVGYAEMVSGFRYRLKHPDSVLRRWEETVRRLRGDAGEP